MNEKLKTLFFGRKCDLCKKSGIRCAQVGVFTSEPALTGQRVIYLLDKPVLRTGETIAECPVARGEKTVLQAYAQIKKNMGQSGGQIDIIDPMRQ